MMQRSKIIASLCAWAVLSLSHPAARANSDATLSPTAAQTIKGWGLFPNDNLIYQATNVQDAVYATGINYARFRIPPAAGNTNGTINPNALVPILQGIQLARRHGCNHYQLSLWSPPAYMKTPSQTTLGTSNGQSNGTPENLASNYEGALVQYVVNVLRWLNELVPLPDAVSLENEPDTHPVWDGCDYSTTAATQALWRQAVKDLRAALDSNGMGSVQIIGPECYGTGGAMTFLGSSFSNLSSDSALNQAIGAYAAHTYDLTSWSGYVAGIQAHPKDAWQSEFSVSGMPDNVGTTLYAVRRLMSDVVDMPHNYWFWWLGWQTTGASTGEELVRTPSDGASTWTGTQLYYTFKQLWTSIPAPCELKKLTTTDPDLKPAAGNQGPWVDLAAFENTNGTAILIANSTSTAKTFNLHQCTYGIKADYYRTDSTGAMVWQGTLPISSTRDVTNVSIPASSVTLVVCGSSNTPSRYETETLSVASYYAQSGGTERILPADASLSDGDGTMLDSNDAGDYVTFRLPNVAAADYNVKVGVQMNSSRGQFQLQAGAADNFAGTAANVGPVCDEYSASVVYTQVDLGTWTAAATGDEWFRFSVVGKNRASAGSSYNCAVCLDYILLTPQYGTYGDWVLHQFTSAQAADASISGALADPDGDGVPNLVEFAMGGNPLVADAPTASLHPSPLLAGAFAFTFSLRAGLGDVQYGFQASTNLATWASVLPASLTTLSSNGGVLLEQAAFPRPAGVSFFRLNFSRPGS